MFLCSTAIHFTCTSFSRTAIPIKIYSDTAEMAEKIYFAHALPLAPCFLLSIKKLQMQMWNDLSEQKTRDFRVTPVKVVLQH